MQERIEKFEKILEKDLKEELDKINNAGTVTPEEVKTVKDAVKLMLKIQKYKNWMMGEGENSYGGYSTRRGRSAITGRYVSMDPYPQMRSYDTGYSGHNRMIDELERMYNEAGNDHERRMIEEWIKTAEMNR